MQMGMGASKFWENPVCFRSKNLQTMKSVQIDVSFNKLKVYEGVPGFCLNEWSVEGEGIAPL